MILPIAVPGQDTLSRDIMRTVRYGMHRDLQNFTFKSLATQCTLQCVLKVVVTREESSEAMTECVVFRKWLMFDAVLSGIGVKHHPFRNCLSRFVTGNNDLQCAL